MATPGPDAQINDPLLLPHPELLRLPETIVFHVPDGVELKVRPSRLVAPEKPRFTPPITSLTPDVIVAVELIAIVSVAELVPISKLYVAAGQPGSVPQLVSVKVPTESAMAGAV